MRTTRGLARAFAAVLIALGLLVAIAPAARAADGKIEGKVQLPDGAATASWVTVYTASNDGWVGTGMSDPSTGAYSISVAPGTYKVKAGWMSSGGSTDPGYVGRFYPSAKLSADAATVTVTDGGTRSGTDITLARAGAISGTVTDENGKPLSGISISGIPTPSTANASYGSAVTGSDGTYAMRGLEPGSYKVQFTTTDGSRIQEYFAGASTFGDAATVFANTGTTTPSINASLDPAGSIAGTVKDGSGNAVSGVSVRVYVESPSGGSSSPSYYATTTNTGAYVVKGLPTGDYTVAFTAPSGSALMPAKRSTTVAVAAPAAVTGIDQTLFEGGRISGTVRSSSGPLAGARVTAIQQGTTYNSFTSTTSANGTYTISGLPEGQYKVEFGSGPTASVVTTYFGADTQSAATVIPSGPGQIRTGVDRTVVRAGSISGTLKKPDGTPVTLGVASLNAVWVGDGGPGYNPSVVGWGNGGSFTLSGLQPGTWALRMSGTGFLDRYYPNSPTLAGATLITIAEGEAKTGYDLTLVTGGTVTGKISDENGAVTYGTVGLFTQPQFESNAGWMPTRTSMLDSTGTYLISGLESGKYYVGTQRNGAWYGGGTTVFRGDASTLGDADPVTVTAGQSTAGVDIAFPRPGKISGKISPPAGRTLNFAHATVYPVRGDGSFDPDVSQSGWADDTGAFTIGGLAPGRYLARFTGGADDEQYLERWNGDAATAEDAVPFTVTAGQTVTGVNATLRSGQTISGTIKDAQGSPIESGYVSVSGALYDSISASADAQGAFRLSGLTDGTYTLTFKAYGYAAKQRRVTVAGGNVAAIDVALAPLPTLSGKVTRPNGAPVIDATVVVYDEQNDSEYTSAFTSVDGTWKVAGIEPGAHRVVVRKTGSRTVFWDGATGSTSALDAELLDIKAGQDRVLNAVLPLGAEITGTVKYPYGSAVGYSAVDLFDASGTAVASTITSYDGRFTFSGLADGSYKIRASTYSPYVPTFNGNVATIDAAPLIATSIATPAGSQTITLIQSGGGNGGTTPTTPIATISGKLTDAQGTPLAGVSVTASGTANNGQGVYSSSVSGGDGRFNFGLPAGKYRIAAGGSSSVGTPGYLLRYYPGTPKYDEATLVTTSVAQPATGIDLSLPLGATLAGTVVDSDGAPVGNASVTLYRNSGDYGIAVQTTPKGRFRLVGLEPGTVKLRVTPSSTSGFSSRWADDADSFDDATPISLAAGGSTTHTITVNRGGAISGTVRDARGGGVGGASVSAITLSGTWARTVRTRSDGSYRLAGLDRATYRLRFSPPTKRPELLTGYSGNATTLAAAAKFSITRTSEVSDVDVTLASGAMLRGTVRSEGQPLPGAGVGVWLAADTEEEPDEVSTITDEDGRYELAVPEGAVKIRFWATGYLGKTHGTTVTTDAASPTTVDGALTRATSISGQVLGLGGSAIGSTYSDRPTVSLYDEDGEFVDRTTAGSRTGSYVFDGLQAGTYLAKFVAPSYAGEAYDDQPYGERGTPIVVGVGERKRGVNARLERGGTIRGTLTSSDGHRVGYGVVVRARDTAGKLVGEAVSLSYAAGEDAAYYLEGLPAGPVTLEFDGTNYDGGDGSAEPFVREFHANSPTLGGATPVTVKIGEEVRVDAELTPQQPVARGTIAGVISGPGGPVKGATVVVFKENGDELDDLQTAADGSYAFQALRPGKYRIGVSAEGYQNEYYDNAGDLDDATELTVTSSATTTANVQLALAPPRLEGTVLKPGGAAVVGATVSVFAASATADSAPLASTTTTSDGSWSIETLSPGTYKLRASATGFKPQFHAGKPSLAEATPVTLETGKTTTIPAMELVVLPGSISGTVTVAGGSALSGAAVTAYDSATGAVKAATTSDATGVFTLGDLPPGSYKVGFAAAGRSPVFNGGAATLAAAAGLMVSSGQSITGINATLATAPATTGSISGTVKDTAGALLPGVTVTLYDGPQIVGAATTQVAGTYRFDGLAAKTTYALGFNAPGKIAEFHLDQATLEAANRLTVNAGVATTADAVLAAQASVLRGRVTDAAGAVSGATVTLYGATGTATNGAAATTGGAGTFAFERPAGSYRIGVEKAGFGTRFYDAKGSLAEATIVTVAAGETKDDLDVKLTSLTAPGAGGGGQTGGGGGQSGGDGQSGGGDGQTGGGGSQSGGGQPGGDGGSGQVGGGQPGSDGGSGNAQTPKSQPIAAPTLALTQSKKLEVAKGGVVTVKLDCPSGSACTATASLVYQPPKSKKGKKKPAPVVIGTASMNLAKSGTVTIALNAKGTKLVRAAGQRSLNVSLVITLAGTKAPASTTKVALTAAKAKGKKKALASDGVAP